MAYIDTMICHDCKWTVAARGSDYLYCPMCRSDQFDYVDSRPCYARVQFENENYKTLFYMWRDDMHVRAIRLHRMEYYATLEHIVRSGHIIRKDLRNG
jgi:hypothetical protein